jgi:hypothetical protein
VRRKISGKNEAQDAKSDIGHGTIPGRDKNGELTSG